MINSNELRLGNLVAYRQAEKTEPTIHRIIRIERVTARLDKCPEGEMFNYSDREYSDIEGIPLTSEWLDRSGFKWNSTIHRWVHGCGYMIVKDSYGFTNGLGNGTFEQAPLKYVHQLQNLFYSLTGSELFIKGASLINELTYKGYTAAVEHKPADFYFYGKITGIDDLVSFEAATENDLEQAFQEAVDDYIETCKELGKEPQKP